MNEMKKNALKNTAREVINFSVGLIALISVVGLLFYIASSTDSIVKIIGAKTSLAIMVILVILFSVYIRYKINLDKLKEKKRLEWLNISTMKNDIPEGKYNLELRSGRIIWKATKQVFETHRNEVVRWMAK